MEKYTVDLTEKVKNLELKIKELENRIDLLYRINSVPNQTYEISLEERKKACD
mgnify:FL=1